MGNLLKEAIADAKAIRETALANAKLALEEAFTPKLQQMFNEKIQNEIEGDEDQFSAEAPVEAPAAPAEDPMGAAAPEAPAIAPEMGAAEPDGDEFGMQAPVEDVPVEEPISLDGSEEEEPQMFEGTKEVTSDADANPEAQHGVTGKNSKIGLPVAKTTSLKETADEDEDDMNEPTTNLDLESIIRELNSDEEEEKVDESTKEVTSDADANPEGAKGGDKDSKMGQPIAKTTQLKEFNFDKKEDEDEEEKVDEMGMPQPGMGEAPAQDAEINIDEILRELQAQDAAPQVAAEQPMFEATVNENKQLKKKLADTTEALKEYKSVVVFLKDKLNEINLLNAKLLFTNKLFKAHSMNNAQKMKVIENFDRAKSLREVKLVFATISESLSQTAAVIKKPTTVKKITEGFASKATTSTKVKVKETPVKEVISEGIVSADAATRLRKLAGIIK